jgi:hypothetical protein
MKATNSLKKKQTNKSLHAQIKWSEICSSQKLEMDVNKMPKVEEKVAL